MAPRKAPGNDHLTGAMLKPIAHSLSSILSKFFKLCWNWSYVPTSFRTAQVVPIYTKGDPTAAGNFRPISLTNVFRKILERCLLPKLLNTINSLDISQGGFRHHRGALDQALSLNMLIHQYQKQYDSLSTQAYMDIRAAYDSVDHNIIWSKLQNKLPSALFHMV